MTEIYNKTNPYLASICERYQLTKPGSKKKTSHIVLDLGDSGLKYEVGDSIVVHPQNSPEIVLRTLRAMKATGEEIIETRQGEKLKLLDFLYRKANLNDVNRKLCSELGSRQVDVEKKAQLEDPAYATTREVWDVLWDHREVTFTPQELVGLIMPLLPRYYSIASSINAGNRNEVHLTVAPVEYETHGHIRRGVCTHYLCDISPLNQAVIPVYIQPHKGFTIPDPQAHMIMVGPGTGVAPFRAFMQERLLQNAKGKHWLFFGEWNRKTDYFYESFWEEIQTQTHLQIDLAFSRDQAEKIYVQHRMLEKGEELFNWLEEGAHFYVCGDAHRMAKDVEATLIKVIQVHGKQEEQDAKQYLKRLRTEKRYLRDVY